MKARISLRSLLVAVAFASVAIVAANRLPLWRDTIYHSADDAVLCFPSGEQIPTNQWLVADSQHFSRLLTGGPDVTYLLSRDKAGRFRHVVMRIGQNEYAAVVERSLVHGPRHRAEVWLRPVPLSDIVTWEAKKLEARSPGTMVPVQGLNRP